MIKITRLERPLPGCDMFSGNATGDDGKPYCFYYTPRRRFAVMKQDAGVPTAWFYCDPPDGMKKAVQKAIKSTLEKS